MFGEVIKILISLGLHFATSFAMKYCCDREIIWHNNETPPNLHMPKLYDLNEKCDVYKQQKYVDKVIIPSNNYFSMISDIEYYQKNDSFILKMVVKLLTFLFVENTFRKTQITQYVWLNLIMGIVFYLLIILVVHIIYNRTRLKLGTFQLRVSELKKDFYYLREHCEWEFDVPEEKALNNFIIEKHHSYIRCVHYTIEKRYQLKKALETIVGWIYLLFIMRIDT